MPQRLILERSDVLVLNPDQVPNPALLQAVHADNALRLARVDVRSWLAGNVDLIENDGAASPTSVASRVTGRSAVAASEGVEVDMQDAASVGSSQHHDDHEEGPGFANGRKTERQRSTSDCSPTAAAALATRARLRHFDGFYLYDSAGFDVLSHGDLAVLGPALEALEAEGTLLVCENAQRLFLASPECFSAITLSPDSGLFFAEPGSTTAAVTASAATLDESGRDTHRSLASILTIDPAGLTRGLGHIMVELQQRPAQRLLTVPVPTAVAGPGRMQLQPVRVTDVHAALSVAMTQAAAESLVQDIAATEAEVASAGASSAQGAGSAATSGSTAVVPALEFLRQGGMTSLQSAVLGAKHHACDALPSAPAFLSRGGSVVASQPDNDDDDSSGSASPEDVALIKSQILANLTAAQGQLDPQHQPMSAVSPIVLECVCDTIASWPLFGVSRMSTYMLYLDLVAFAFECLARDAHRLVPLAVRLRLVALAEAECVTTLPEAMQSVYQVPAEASEDTEDHIVPAPLRITQRTAASIRRVVAATDDDASRIDADDDSGAGVLTGQRPIGASVRAGAAGGVDDSDYPVDDSIAYRRVLSMQRELRKQNLLYNVSAMQQREVFTGHEHVNATETVADAMMNQLLAKLDYVIENVDQFSSVLEPFRSSEMSQYDLVDSDVIMHVRALRHDLRTLWASPLSHTTPRRNDSSPSSSRPATPGPALLTPPTPDLLEPPAAPAPVGGASAPLPSSSSANTATGAGSMPPPAPVPVGSGGQPLPAPSTSSRSAGGPGGSTVPPPAPVPVGGDGKPLPTPSQTSGPSQPPPAPAPVGGSASHTPTPAPSVAASGAEGAGDATIPYMVQVWATDPIALRFSSQGDSAVAYEAVAERVNGVLHIYVSRFHVNFAEAVVHMFFQSRGFSASQCVLLEALVSRSNNPAGEPDADARTRALSAGAGSSEDQLCLVSDRIRRQLARASYRTLLGLVQRTGKEATRARRLVGLPLRQRELLALLAHQIADAARQRLLDDVTLQQVRVRQLDTDLGGQQPEILGSVMQASPVAARLLPLLAVQLEEGMAVDPYADEAQALLKLMSWPAEASSCVGNFLLAVHDAQVHTARVRCFAQLVTAVRRLNPFMVREPDLCTVYSEFLGLKDEESRSVFGISKFDLGARLLTAVRAEMRRDDADPASLVRPQCLPERRTHEKAFGLRNYTISYVNGLFFMFPTLLNLLLVLITGYGVFTSTAMPAEDQRAVSYALLLSFIVTGAGNNIIARLGAMYSAQWSFSLVLVVLSRLLGAVFLAVLLTASVASLLLSIGPSSATTIIVFFLYMILFSAMLTLTAALFNMHRGSIFTSAEGAAVLGSLALSYLLVLLLMLVVPAALAPEGTGIAFLTSMHPQVPSLIHLIGLCLNVALLFGAFRHLVHRPTQLLQRVHLTPEQGILAWYCWKQSSGRRRALKPPPDPGAPNAGAAIIDWYRVYVNSGVSSSAPHLEAVARAAATDFRTRARAQFGQAVLASSRRSWLAGVFARKSTDWDQLVVHRAASLPHEGSLLHWFSLMSSLTDEPDVCSAEWDSLISQAKEAMLLKQKTDYLHRGGLLWELCRTYAVHGSAYFALLFLDRIAQLAVYVAVPSLAAPVTLFLPQGQVYEVASAWALIFLLLSLGGLEPLILRMAALRARAQAPASQTRLDLASRVSYSQLQQQESLFQAHVHRTELVRFLCLVTAAAVVDGLLMLAFGLAVPSAYNVYQPSLWVTWLAAIIAYSGFAVAAFHMLILGGKHIAAVTRELLIAIAIGLVMGVAALLTWPGSYNPAASLSAVLIGSWLYAAGLVQQMLRARASSTGSFVLPIGPMQAARLTTSGQRWIGSSEASDRERLALIAQLNKLPDSLGVSPHTELGKETTRLLELTIAHLSQLSDASLLRAAFPLAASRLSVVFDRWSRGLIQVILVPEAELQLDDARRFAALSVLRRAADDSPPGASPTRTRSHAAQAGATLYARVGPRGGVAASEVNSMLEAVSRDARRGLLTVYVACNLQAPQDVVARLVVSALLHESFEQLWNMPHRGACAGELLLASELGADQLPDRVDRQLRATSSAGLVRLEKGCDDAVLEALLLGVDVDRSWPKLPHVARVFLVRVLEEVRPDFGAHVATSSLAGRSVMGGGHHRQYDGDDDDMQSSSTLLTSVTRATATTLNPVSRGGIASRFNVAEYGVDLAILLCDPDVSTALHAFSEGSSTAGTRVRRHLSDLQHYASSLLTSLVARAQVQASLAIVVKLHARRILEARALPYAERQMPIPPRSKSLAHARRFGSHPQDDLHSHLLTHRRYEAPSSTSSRLLALLDDVGRLAFMASTGDEALPRELDWQLRRGTTQRSGAGWWLRAVLLGAPTVATFAWGRRAAVWLMMSTLRDRRPLIKSLEAAQRSGRNRVIWWAHGRPVRVEIVHDSIGALLDGSVTDKESSTGFVEYSADSLQQNKPWGKAVQAVNVYAGRHTTEPVGRNGRRTRFEYRDGLLVRRFEYDAHHDVQRTAYYSYRSIDGEPRTVSGGSGRGGDAGGRQNWVPVSQRVYAGLVERQPAHNFSFLQEHQYKQDGRISHSELRRSVSQDAAGITVSHRYAASASPLDTVLESTTYDKVSMSGKGGADATGRVTLHWHCGSRYVDRAVWQSRRGAPMRTSTFSYQHAMHPKISTVETLPDGTERKHANPWMLEHDPYDVLKYPSGLSIFDDDLLAPVWRLRGVHRGAGLTSPFRRHGSTPVPECATTGQLSSRAARKLMWTLWTRGYIEGPIARILDERALRLFEPLLRSYWLHRDVGRIAAARNDIMSNQHGIQAAVYLEGTPQLRPHMCYRVADLLAVGRGGESHLTSSGVLGAAGSAGAAGKTPAPGSLAAAQSQSAVLNVAGLDSGTWPADGGGVASCRRDVVDRLPRLRWSIIAEVGSPWKLMRYQIERNIDHVDLVPLWGTEIGGPNEFIYADHPWGALAQRSWRTTDAVVHRLFLPLLMQLVLLCDDLRVGKEQPVSHALSTFVNLHTYFQHFDWTTTWNHASVAVAWRRAWVALERRATRASGDRMRAEMASLADLDDAMQLFMHLLMPLSVPLRPVPVYHATHHGLQAVLGAVAKHVCGSSLVIWDHGMAWRERVRALAELTHVGLFVRNALVRLSHVASLVAYASADAVVSCSATCNPVWQMHIGGNRGNASLRDMMRRKMSPVVNGVETDRFFVNHSAEDPRPTAIMLSHVYDLKDIITAIRAAGIIVRQYGLASFHLLVYGSLDKDTQYVQRCRELIATLDLGANVTLAGLGAAPKVLPRGWVFVNSSQSEGLPLALGEAGTAGIPVVCTDVGGSEEVVRDALTGVTYGAVVPPQSPASLARGILNVLGMFGSLDPAASEASSSGGGGGGSGGSSLDLYIGKPAELDARIRRMSPARHCLGMQFRTYILERFSMQRYLREHEQTLWTAAMLCKERCVRIRAIETHMLDPTPGLTRHFQFFPDSAWSGADDTMLIDLYEPSKQAGSHARTGRVALLEWELKKLQHELLFTKTQYGTVSGGANDPARRERRLRASLKQRDPYLQPQLGYRQESVEIDSDLSPVLSPHESSSTMPTISSASDTTDVQRAQPPTSKYLRVPGARGDTSFTSSSTKDGDTSSRMDSGSEVPMPGKRQTAGAFSYKGTPPVVPTPTIGASPLGAAVLPVAGNSNGDVAGNGRGRRGSIDSNLSMIAIRPSFVSAERGLHVSPLMDEERDRTSPAIHYDRGSPAINHDTTPPTRAVHQQLSPLPRKADPPEIQVDEPPRGA